MARTSASPIEGDGRMEGLLIVTAKARTTARKTRKKLPAQKASAATEPVDGVLRGSDLGSPLQLARGVVEFSTEVHVPDDPSDKRSLTRLTARAQRVWAPDRLIRGRNPAISADQYQAAQRFYDDFVIGELGARPNQTRGGVRLDPWARLPFSEQRYQRRVSWERAVMSVGDRFLGILVWCVLQLPSLDRADIPPTVEAWAKAQTPDAWSTERAVGFLAGALESLAVHYGYTKTNSPSARMRAREGRA